MDAKVANLDRSAPRRDRARRHRVVVARLQFDDERSRHQRHQYDAPCDGQSCNAALGGEYALATPPWTGGAGEPHAGMRARGKRPVEPCGGHEHDAGGRQQNQPERDTKRSPHGVISA